MPTYSDGGPFAHGDNFTKWLEPFIGKPVFALEVGSWEGRSALWMMDNILTHPQAHLTCVDSWEGEEVQQRDGKDFAMVERNFRANTQAYRESGRLGVFKGRSEEALPRAVCCPIVGMQVYSFAYVDGSHIAADVLSDMILAWAGLKPGGVMIMDDYAWTEGPSELHRPRMAIDMFLNVFQERLVVLGKGYQVAVKKL